jgi:hypothetical protein
MLDRQTFCRMKSAFSITRAQTCTSLSLVTSTKVLQVYYYDYNRRKNSGQIMYDKAGR